MTYLEVAGSAQVSGFFELLDAGELSAAAERFAADAVYLRPGFGELRGKQAIRDFLLHRRPLVSSSHTLEAVVAVGRQVAVRGTFRGVLRDGAPAEGRFADFFDTDPDGLVRRRETFFFALPG